MTRTTHTLHTPIHAVLTACLSFIILLGGWEPWEEEQRLHKERILEKGRQYSEQLRKEREARQAEKQRQRVELERRFNAIFFPPPEINNTLYTYETQKYFEAHAGDTFLFKGYLEDMVASDNQVVAEFIYWMHGPGFGRKVAIRYQLTVPEDRMQPLLGGKRFDERFSPARQGTLFGGAEYYIKAKIRNLERVPTYEVGREGKSRNVAEIQVVSYRVLLATGQLIQAIPITDEEDEFFP